ncbi:MAG: Unknown protein [uncultured Thiotrichaceae bacterium]|uniref:DUF3461 family protein n=1 Tax=uncultured Thiotrichaceae bacterium TaxID=298394 RepID=A0A6S6SJU1_9GAMM|nr:MAG: Unknown protein [uncultured Thiotrichaceae bacterium]
MRKSDLDKSSEKKSNNEECMPDSPLKTMGISCPAEITRYTLRQEDKDDVLRVYDKRAKGSFLPASKKFTFGRSHKTIISDSGKSKYTDEQEISPILQAAIAELDQIVKHSGDVAEQKKVILDDIEHMEKYLCAKVKDLRSQIESL